MPVTYFDRSNSKSEKEQAFEWEVTWTSVTKRKWSENANIACYFPKWKATKKRNWTTEQKTKNYTTKSRAREREAKGKRNSKYQRKSAHNVLHKGSLKSLEKGAKQSHKKRSEKDTVFGSFQKEPKEISHINRELQSCQWFELVVAGAVLPLPLPVAAIVVFVYEHIFFAILAG